MLILLTHVDHVAERVTARIVADSIALKSGQRALAALTLDHESSAGAVFRMGVGLVS